GLPEPLDLSPISIAEDLLPPSLAAHQRAQGGATQVPTLHVSLPRSNGRSDPIHLPSAYETARNTIVEFPSRHQLPSGCTQGGVKWPKLQLSLGRSDRSW